MGRVLISSTAGQGHVQPLVPLARALRARGDEVLWVAPPEARCAVDAAAIEFAPAGEDVQWCLAEFARRWPQAAELAPESAGPFMFPRLFGEVAPAAAAPALAAVLEGFAPELVVHEVAELAAPALACHAKVVAHGIGLGIPPALLEEARVRAAEALRTAVPPDAPLVDLCPPSLRSPDVHHRGPTLPLRSATLEALPGERLEPRVAEAIDAAAGRPVVHVTFGTVLRDPVRLGRIARAIAASGALAVVAGEIDEEAPGVVAAARLPYALLLPRCSAVVSHAGAGVLLKSLAAGLPQVCLPQAASDQFRNAAACAAAGAGLTVDDDGQVPTAVERLLGEPAFAASARRIAAEIAAMPSADAVAAALTGADRLAAADPR